MKYAIVFSSLFFSFYANSSVLEVGCVKLVPFCSSAEKCTWAAEPGQLTEVTLSKKGDGPTYEIWEGKSNLVLYGQPFELEIYQRRDSNDTVNYLTINIPLNSETLITGSGREVALIRHFQASTQSGTGIRCTSAVVPQ